MDEITEAALIEEIVDALAMGEISQTADEMSIVRLTAGSLSLDFGGDTTFVVTVTAHSRVQ